MSTSEKSATPEQLIAQLADEEAMAEAFEALVNLGDASIPALSKALSNPDLDHEIIFSVLSSIESEAAFKVLTDQLHRTKDADEQATLALLLATDEREEIAPWLVKQLPADWQNAKWWKGEEDAKSHFIATMLASLIALGTDESYLEWYDTVLDGENAKQMAVAAYINDILNEFDIIEYEDE